MQTDRHVHVDSFATKIGYCTDATSDRGLQTQARLVVGDWPLCASLLFCARLVDVVTSMARFGLRGSAGTGGRRLSFRTSINGTCLETSADILSGCVASLFKGVGFALPLPPSSLDLLHRRPSLLPT
jgi:hypothetical protein